MKIECNVGGTERVLRLAIGVVLIAVSYFMLSGALAIIGYLIGIINLIVGITTYCPVNSLMGRNTCKVKHG